MGPSCLDQNKDTKMGATKDSLIMGETDHPNDGIKGSALNNCPSTGEWGDEMDIWESFYGCLEQPGWGAMKQKVLSFHDLKEAKMARSVTLLLETKVELSILNKDTTSKHPKPRFSPLEVNPC